MSELISGAEDDDIDRIFASTAWNAALDTIGKKVAELLNGQIMSSNIHLLNKIIRMIEGVRVKDEGE